jgi:hypothetical protein
MLAFGPRYGGDRVPRRLRQAATHGVQTRSQAADCQSRDHPPSGFCGVYSIWNFANDSDTPPEALFSSSSESSSLTILASLLAASSRTSGVSFGFFDLVMKTSSGGTNYVSKAFAVPESYARAPFPSNGLARASGAIVVPEVFALSIGNSLSLLNRH